jgi:hypothetical protein
LLRFIDWVLTLPPGLEDQLWTEIQSFEEEKRMHYLASFERVAQKRGIAQGQARLLMRLLEERFGPMPEPQAKRVQSAAPEQLETWALRLLDAASLDDVFGRDDQH